MFAGQTHTPSDPSVCHHDIAWLWTTTDGVRWAGTPWGESGADQTGQAWVGDADGPCLPRTVFSAVSLVCCVHSVF